MSDFSISAKDRTAFSAWMVLARAAALGVALVGALVLIGWVFGVDGLKRIRPGYVAMNPATAVSFAFSGGGVWWLSRGCESAARVARCCAGLVLFIGLTRILGYLTGMDLGLDRLLFRAALDAEQIPNRMAPNTAAALLLAGGALVLLSLRRPGGVVLSIVISMGASVPAVLAIVGYLNGVSSLSGVGAYIPMALHTAGCFVALSGALISIGFGRVLSPELRQNGGDPLEGWSGRSVERKVAVGFAAALLAMCVMATASYKSLRQFLADDEWDGHSHQVLVALANLDSSLSDAESAWRGFAISGQEEFLEPYHAAAPAIGPMLNGIRAMTSDNAGQQARLDSLEPLVRARLAHLEQGIELRRASGFDAASAWVAAGEGKRTMDQIREVLARMHEEEMTLLESRTARVARDLRITMIIICAGVLLALALLGGAGWMIGRDITKRRRAEDHALRLGAVVDQSDDAIISEDLAGTVVSWNSGATRLFGQQASEMIGRDLSLLMPPDRAEEYRRFVARIRAGERVIRVETVRVTRDGRAVDVALTLSPIRNARGEIVGVSKIARDVTEQNRAGEELRRAKLAADAANAAKSEFLAHMSHEIRTPLNGVIGMIDLVLGTELSDNQKRYAALAKSSAESLTTVINDILDFSKIEAGKLEIVSSDFDLHRAVEDVMEVLALKASRKGIELACHVEPDVPALVRGDGDRLRQILINLLNNAIKFTDRGAVVVRLSTDSRSEGKATVRFTITDTGIGISRDRMERLFRAFSQADASTTRVYGGTGLGLAISKQLAELMGGKIGVESEPGRGSTFWFTAVFRTRDQEGRLEGRERIDPRHMRVLAIDDNDLQRTILREQIGSWGLEAATAGDGKEALRILSEAAERSAPFRVALVDGDMPGMDGFELASAIKARADIRETVLMILLSVESDIPRQRLRSMGFSGHMTKPVRQSQLFNAIMEAIAGAERHPAPALPSAGGPAPEAVRSAGHRVLLAEDNEINQIVAREILTKAGYECDVVPDGKQAVEAVQVRRYDLVLMDCQMPIMDGFEATRQIRRLAQTGGGGAPGRTIPIVALTANAMKGDRERCLEAGMSAYTSKPINPGHLLATIATLIDQTRRGSKAA